jgi:hypothetical protein
MSWFEVIGVLVFMHVFTGVLLLLMVLSEFEDG